MLVARIEAGEAADVLILSRAGIDTLRKTGKIAPGSDVTLAGSGVAIAVKAGAPKPDISTPEALKATLLRAKSIAYSEPSPGGASGVYFAKLIERLGIAHAIKAKTKFPPPGGFSGTLLVTGEAELDVLVGEVEDLPKTARDRLGTAGERHPHDCSSDGDDGALHRQDLHSGSTSAPPRVALFTLASSFRAPSWSP